MRSSRESGDPDRKLWIPACAGMSRRPRLIKRYSEISGAPSGILNGAFSGTCEGSGFGVIEGTVGGGSMTGGGGKGPRGISAAGIFFQGGAASRRGASSRAPRDTLLVCSILDVRPAR